MLEDEGVGVAGSRVSRSVRARGRSAWRTLREGMPLAVGAAALAQQLARELAHATCGCPGSKSRMRFSQCSWKACTRSGSQPQPASRKPMRSVGKRSNRPVEDARGERHLHLVPVAEDVRQDERVDLLGDAGRQVDARRAVHADARRRARRPPARIGMEVGMAEVLRQPDRAGTRRGAAGCGTGRLGGTWTPIIPSSSTQRRTSRTASPTSASEMKPTGKQPPAVTRGSRRRCSRCRRACRRRRARGSRMASKLSVIEP